MRPFDLDAFVQRLWRRVRRRGRAAPPRWVFAIAAFAVIVGWLSTGFYSVPQGDRGVLLHMGREVRVVLPGAHWRWPLPLASDRVLSVRQIHIVAIGYQHTSKLYEGEPTPVQASMLTRGQSVVHMQFAVQYRIAHPSRYLFRVSHPRRTIARAAEAAMRQAVAGTTSAVLLTSGEQSLEFQVKAALQKTLDRYDTGVRVVAVKIQKAAPPKAVEAALQKVVRAREDALRLQSQAQGYANAILPKALADAATLIDKADAYSTTIVAKAKGRAARFLALARIDKTAPAITRERLYIDGMTRVYRQAGRVVLSDSPHTVVHIPFRGSGRDPLPTPAPPVGVGAKP